jgi:hypothetical protein
MGVALEVEAILERVQSVQGLLNGSLFGPIHILGKEQFPPTGNERSLGDSNPLA